MIIFEHDMFFRASAVLNLSVFTKKSGKVIGVNNYTISICRYNSNVIFRQGRTSMKPLFNCLHCFFAQTFSLFVDLFTHIDDGVEAFPGHAFHPLRHDVNCC